MCTRCALKGASRRIYLKHELLWLFHIEYDIQWLRSTEKQLSKLFADWIILLDLEE